MHTRICAHVLPRLQSTPLGDTPPPGRDVARGRKSNFPPIATRLPPRAQTVEGIRHTSQRERVKKTSESPLIRFDSVRIENEWVVVTTVQEVGRFILNPKEMYRCSWKRFRESWTTRTVVKFKISKILCSARNGQKLFWNCYHCCAIPIE